VLVGRLPLVHEALPAGVIDRGKALVFVRHLAELTAEQIEVLCRAVLPKAGGWTTGQIAHRLLGLIIRIDPAHYERRYRKAVRDRQVIGYLDRDGSATVTGTGLPVEDAAAALERVDGLARAVRRAGHPATLDQLRADLFLGLLAVAAGVAATVLSTARSVAAWAVGALLGLSGISGWGSRSGSRCPPCSATTSTPVAGPRPGAASRARG
jgi:hypothetical protein